ncbi:MAG: 4-alpha-glucanotransferase, partial [Lachnospiraceae bacterium]|nr:4-alpha-glucanotransferase [Lachnospiraceae bacterium]
MKKKNLLSKRGSGVLMPVSSLPSPYGIGTFGKAAYDFVDALNKANQTYWQVLPVGPTSFGDSPYQSFSAFAGNPYFIDLDILVSKGYITKDYITSISWGDDASRVDYEIIYNNRFKVLKKAFEKVDLKTLKSYKEFEKCNGFWLDDYALYMALKNENGGKEWLLWDKELRFRKKDAIKAAKKRLKKE